MKDLKSQKAAILLILMKDGSEQLIIELFSNFAPAIFDREDPKAA
jgi:hypothetical protein